MIKKFFISNSVGLKLTEELLTPISLGGKDPKTHFITSVELKTSKKDVEGFIKNDSLAQESLEYILYLFSYLHFRLQSFNFLCFNPEGVDFERFKTNVINKFKSEKDKWGLGDNIIQIITGCEFEEGVLLSIAYSGGETTILDINQEFKSFNKLMIGGVYISKSGFIVNLGIKRSGIWKQVLNLINSLLETKDINDLIFTDLHFSKFYNTLEQVTKSGQFQVSKGQKYKSTITRGESGSNLKEVISIGNFADLRGYPNKEEFKDINISMSKSESFPRYTISILKNISDSKFIELVEYIYGFLFKDSDINGSRESDFLMLLEKKVRGDGEIFIHRGFGVVPNRQLDLFKSELGISLAYRHVGISTDGKSNDIIDQSNIILYSGGTILNLCNGKDIIIDDTCEYGITLSKDQAAILNGFEYKDEIGFYRNMEHSSDGTKKVLFVITALKYSLALDRLSDLGGIDFDSTKIIILSFDPSDRDKRKDFKILPRPQKYGGKQCNGDITFKPSLMLLDVINNDQLVDFLIDGIYEGKDHDFFKLFYGEKRPDLIEIQNLIYSQLDSLDIAKELLERFKSNIESRSSFLIHEYVTAIGENRKAIETYIQELFNNLILGAYSHILPEVNTHRGPMDFLSISKGSYTVIEFKLASNSNKTNNLEFQTEVYKKTLGDSGKEIHIMKVVFYANEKEKADVEKIIEEKQLDKSCFMFVDYSRNTSASNVKNESEI